MSRRIVFCLAAAFLPLAAHADDTPITVTATRIATPVGQVPAGVTVLTSSDFAARGDTTLVDALTQVPGLNVVQSGGPGNAASVFIRGTDSEDVLVLMDGVPVNDPSEANGAFNFGTVTLADVERVEVVRGAMSGLYGSNAIGGVINIITKRGTKPSKAEISLGGGWPAQGQGSVSLSGVAGKLDYALTGGLDEEAGFDATPKRMGSVYAGQRDPYRATLGSLQLGYEIAPDTRLYAIVRHQSSDSAFPNLDFPVFDDPDEFDYNTSLFSKLGLSSTLFSGRLTTDLSVAWERNSLYYKNLLDEDDPNQAAANDKYQGNRTDVQWNNNLRLPDAGIARYSTLSFGVEYIRDSTKENVDELSFGSPFIETVHGAQHTVAGHAGLQTTLANRLTLTAALRDDSVSSFGNAVTWRLGGVLTVPEVFANLKASAGTGFLAPSLFDLHYVDNFGDSGNPDLKPERSTGWEIGPEFVLPAFGRAAFADITATYFHNSIRDLIEAEPTSPLAYTFTEENVDRATINGVETELVLKPADWISADLSYTYTHAVDDTGGAPLLRRPRHAASATLTITPVPRLTIVPQVQYVGRFEDYLYDDSGYPAGDGSSDPGTIVNLNVSYRLDERFTLFATGRNIFSSKFESPNGLQIPGASLLLGVRATVE